ncbi:hypothetical protein A8U91_03940 [Halomonas elongata]|uniref:Uncharacterized protein n=1 Tax=Halomonas elongata TaxID=2746 RepID=A0A1B8NXZ5_HALEL|nr:hypothetical protein [Halomonas elongata]OBX34877.1 hypothetical protein A8U91_03940 [Halomonas elongata]
MGTHKELRRAKIKKVWYKFISSLAFVPLLLIVLNSLLLVESHGKLHGLSGYFGLFPGIRPPLVMSAGNVLAGLLMIVLVFITVMAVARYNHYKRLEGHIKSGIDSAEAKYFERQREKEQDR